MNKDLKYWVALSTNLQIGAKTFLRLLNIADSMEEIWKMPLDRLRSQGIDEKIISAIYEVRSTKNPDQELEKLKKFDIQAITIQDKQYPKLLKEVPDKPALLYLKGEFTPEDSLALAVVGSRKFTSYGQRVTEEIVRGLASDSITIVSGLALGIDAIAHKTALETKNGRTIGILGCGLDQIYPISNKYLADKMIRENRGVLISEFPLGTPALKHHFPFRNRIIAGLTLGTLVVEGALKSGSLITARAALDYNREVFAVPGSIFNPTSEGPNHLIKIGAKVVLTYTDILDELNIQSKSQAEKASQIIADTKEEALVLEILEKDNSIHVDKITKLTQLDIDQINSTLVMMEIKGKIKNLGGNFYIRK